MRKFLLVILLLCSSAFAQTFVYENTNVHNGILRYDGFFIPASLPNPAPMVIFLHGAIGDTGVTCSTISSVWTCTDASGVCAGDTPALPYPCGVALQNVSVFETVCTNLKAVCLFVTPTYVDNSTHNVKQWFWSVNFFDSAFAATGHPPDDVGFVSQLVGHVQSVLASTYSVHINPLKIVLTGFSTGGFMAHRVGAALSTTFAGVLAMSGGLCASSTVTSPVCSGLPPFSPTAVIMEHGFQDNVVAYNGCETFTCAATWANLIGNNDYPKKNTDYGYWDTNLECTVESTASNVNTDYALSGITITGGVATATCATTCPGVVTSDSDTIYGATGNTALNAYKIDITGTAGSPVTSFTYNTAQTASGTGGFVTTPTPGLRGQTASVLNATGNGTSITINASTNFGTLLPKQAVYLASQSPNTYAGGYAVASVTGNPATSITVAARVSNTNTATGGNLVFSDKVSSSCLNNDMVQFFATTAGHQLPGEINIEAYVASLLQFTPYLSGGSLLTGRASGSQFQ